MAILKRDSLPLFQQYADDAHKYVKSRNWIKLAALLGKIKSADVKKLEENYRHRWAPAGLKMNKYQLRDDIQNYASRIFDKNSAEKILAHLQRGNPLPPRKTHKQVVAAQLESGWSAKDREATRSRLQDPSTWPSSLNHPGLVPRIQGWGLWLLDNYQYIMTAKEPRQIGLRFTPHAKGTDPIKAISDFSLLINQAHLRLIKTCEKGPYGVFVPLPTQEWLSSEPKGCWQLLQKWKAIFTATKGKAAENMRKRIDQDIRKMERLRGNH